MRRRIPLFPLPGVVLLPGTLLPLHIFEPRYRALVADALAGDRTIGMALLKPGWELRGENPPIYPVGGAGTIADSEELPDGRFNIVLEGTFRFRIVAEAAAERYRSASVEEILSVPFPGAQEAGRAREAATRLFDSLSGTMEIPPLPDEHLSAERLASEIAVRLRYAPNELQAILETDSLAGRFGALIGRMVEWQKRIDFLAPFRPGELDVTRN